MKKKLRINTTIFLSILTIWFIIKAFDTLTYERGLSLISDQIAFIFSLILAIITIVFLILLNVKSAYARIAFYITTFGYAVYAITAYIQAEFFPVGNQVVNGANKIFWKIPAEAIYLILILTLIFMYKDYWKE